MGNRSLHIGIAFTRSTYDDDQGDLHGGPASASAGEVSDEQQLSVLDNAVSASTQGPAGLSSLLLHLEPGQLTSPHPPPFKLYRDAQRFTLWQPPAPALGDARCAFDAYRQRHQLVPRPDELDLTRLSTLLYFTYGLSRHDPGAHETWRYHRFVPSARCFFPIELYLWLPQTEHVPAGLYHYDPLHHALELLRPSEGYPTAISQAVAADLGACRALVLLTAFFWKNAFRYRDFSYRLTTQEAGIVASNVLMVSAAMGLDGHIHYQFLDQPMNHLLGLGDTEESLFTVIPLYQSDTTSRPIRRLSLRRTAADSPLHTIPEPIAVPSTQVDGSLRRVCSALVEMDTNSFLEHVEEIIRVPDGAGDQCIRVDERIAPPPPFEDTAELSRALRARSSGGVTFKPATATLDQRVFWEVVRYALAPYTSDIHDARTPPRIRLYIVVNDVHDLAPGIYQLCAHCGSLHVVTRGDMSHTVQAMQSQNNINCLSANMLCYLVGDYPALSALFGNRAYRLLHMEAGLVAHRISVMAAAYGLTARYSTSYDTGKCLSLLGLMRTDLIPAAELVIGTEPPATDAAYRFSILC